jgi:hypothetical protein
MADNRYYGARVEGAKYGMSFGSALAIANILQCQPFDTLANHPRYFGLAVCDLLRTVSVITAVSWDQRFSIRSYCRPEAVGHVARRRALHNQTAQGRT